MGPNWRKIWREKSLQTESLKPAGEKLIEELIDLDGFHGVHGTHSESSFTRVVENFVDACAILSNSAIFEFGSGAGAFLKILEDRYQANVGGLDYSEPLLNIAKSHLTARLGLWHQEAIRPVTLDVRPEIAFSHSVFHYFPNVEYAKNVMANMAQTLRPGCTSMLAILDVRDLEKEAQYIRFRSSSKPDIKKEDLGHLLYHKDFFRSSLLDLGFEKVLILDSHLSEYGNAAYSYDVYASGFHQRP